MIDKPVAQVIAENYKWFCDFYRDLDVLLGKISGRLAAGLAYKSQDARNTQAEQKFSFYQYSNNGPLKPPNPIVVTHRHDSATEREAGIHPVVSVLSVLSLDEQAEPSDAKQVRLIAPMTILRDRMVRDDVVLCDEDETASTIEPSLAVLVHDDYGKKKNSACRVESCERVDPDRYSGVLAVGDRKKVRFACFLVPLDEFSSNKVEDDDVKLMKIIDRKIVQPLSALLMEFRPRNGLVE
jgi:hypothetical protein